MKINLAILNSLIQLKNLKNSSEISMNKDTTNSSNSKNLEVRNNVYTPQKNTKYTPTFLETKALTAKEQASFMKEMLKLPSDIKQLLAMILYKNPSKTALTKMLQPNQPKVDIEVIRQLLETNSKDAINKLIKLVQQTSGNPKDTEQLKHLLSVLNQIIPQKSSNPQDTLTALTLLYLPWLPLEERQDISIKLKKKQEELNEEDDDDTAIILHIATVNLGTFKIKISLNNTNYSFDIQIKNITEKGRKESNQDFQKQIQKNINSEFKKDQIKSNLEFQSSEAKKTEPTKKPEATITQMSCVSPVAIIIAQKLARIIIEADNNLTLLNSREKMIEPTEE